MLFFDLQAQHNIGPETIRCISMCCSVYSKFTGITCHSSHLDFTYETWNHVHGKSNIPSTHRGRATATFQHIMMTHQPHCWHDNPKMLFCPSNWPVPIISLCCVVLTHRGMSHDINVVLTMACSARSYNVISKNPHSCTEADLKPTSGLKTCPWMES